MHHSDAYSRSSVAPVQTTQIHDPALSSSVYLAATIAGVLAKYSRQCYTKYIVGAQLGVFAIRLSYSFTASIDGAQSHDDSNS